MDKISWKVLVYDFDLNLTRRLQKYSFTVINEYKVLVYNHKRVQSTRLRKLVVNEYKSTRLRYKSTRLHYKSTRLQS